MAEKSFWERVGRGIGYGWKKAKEAGARLEDQAEEHLDLRVARDRLQKLHEELGGAVARHAGREGPEKTLDLAEDPFRRLLEAIRASEEEIARLESPRPTGSSEGTSGRPAEG